MSMVAGTASIRYMLRERIWEVAAQRGHQLRQLLRSTQTRVSSIGDVRGRGVMIGVEMIDPRSQLDDLGLHAGDGELALKVQQECFARGLIVERGGRDGCVVRFLPPAIITEEQVQRAAEMFEGAVVEAEMRHAAAR